MDTDVLANAIDALQRCGRRVMPADMPGLWWVDDEHGSYRELTQGQVIDLARQLARHQGSC